MPGAEYTLHVENGWELVNGVKSETTDVLVAENDGSMAAGDLETELKSLRSDSDWKDDLIDTYRSQAIRAWSYFQAVLLEREYQRIIRAHSHINSDEVWNQVIMEESNHEHAKLLMRVGETQKQANNKRLTDIKTQMKKSQALFKENIKELMKMGPESVERLPFIDAEVTLGVVEDFISTNLNSDSDRDTCLDFFESISSKGYGGDSALILDEERTQIHMKVASMQTDHATNTFDGEECVARPSDIEQNAVNRSAASPSLVPSNADGQTTGPEPKSPSVCTTPKNQEQLEKDEFTAEGSIRHGDLNEALNITEVDEELEKQDDLTPAGPRSDSVLQRMSDHENLVEYGKRRFTAQQQLPPHQDQQFAGASNVDLASSSQNTSNSQADQRQQMGYSQYTPQQLQHVVLNDQRNMFYYPNNYNNIPYNYYNTLVGSNHYLPVVQGNYKAFNNVQQQQPLQQLSTAVTNQSQAVQQLTTAVTNQSQPMQQLTTPLPNPNQYAQQITTVVPNQSQPIQQLTTPLPNLNQYVQQLTSAVPNQSQPMQQLTTPLPNPNQYVQQLTTEVPNQSQLVQQLTTLLPNQNQAMQQLATAAPNQNQSPNQSKSMQQLSIPLPNQNQYVQQLMTPLPNQIQSMQQLTPPLHNPNQYIQQLTTPSPSQSRLVQQSLTAVPNQGIPTSFSQSSSILPSTDAHRLDEDAVNHCLNMKRGLLHKTAEAIAKTDGALAFPPPQTTSRDEFSYLPSNSAATQEPKSWRASAGIPTEHGLLSQHQRSLTEDKKDMLLSFRIDIPTSKTDTEESADKSINKSKKLVEFHGVSKHSSEPAEEIKFLWTEEHDRTAASDHSTAEGGSSASMTSNEEMTFGNFSSGQTPIKLWANLFSSKADEKGCVENNHRMKDAACSPKPTNAADHEDPVGYQLPTLAAATDEDWETVSSKKKQRKQKNITEPAATGANYKIVSTISTGAECSICHHNLKKTERHALPCGHADFHHKCARDWIQRRATCPVCRYPIHQT